MIENPSFCKLVFMQNKITTLNRMLANITIYKTTMSPKRFPERFIEKPRDDIE